MPAAVAEVHRLYSSTRAIGSSQMCENSQTILTCHASGNRVTWTAVSGIDLISRILFIDSDQVWTLVNQGTVTGILLQNEPSSDGGNNHNRSFITELFVHSTTQTRTINITCSSGNLSSLHVITPSGNI